MSLPEISNLSRSYRQSTLKNVSPTDQRDDARAHRFAPHRTATLHSTPQRMHARTHSARLPTEYGHTRVQRDTPHHNTHRLHSQSARQPSVRRSRCIRSQTSDRAAGRKMLIKELWVLKTYHHGKIFYVSGPKWWCTRKRFSIVWIPPSDRRHYFGVIVASQTHTHTISYFLPVANPCHRHPTATKTHIIIVFMLE